MGQQSKNWDRNIATYAGKIRPSSLIFAVIFSMIFAKITTISVRFFASSFVLVSSLARARFIEESNDVEIIPLTKQYDDTYLSLERSAQC